jgi:hypothetical protein
MNARDLPPLEVVDVITRIRAELDVPSPRESPLARRMAEIRALQRGFRAEPVGGRLTPFKRVAYWFTASAFDRQAKVVEALIDVTEELSRENERLSRELRHAVSVVRHMETPLPIHDEVAGG